MPAKMPARTTNTSVTAPTADDEPLDGDLRALVQVRPSVLGADALDAIERSAQARAFHQLLDAARHVRLPGFDARGGSVEGVTYTVDYRRLWRFPGSPIRYTQDEIQAMAASLTAQGLLQPLIVAAFDNPVLRGQPGGGGDLVIIDGDLRYLAAAYEDWPREQMTVLIRAKPHSLYDVLREKVTAKLSARPLTAREAGLYVRRLIAVHRALREAGHDLPDLRQEDLGRLVGRSQSEISHALALAALPDDAQFALDTGGITETQAYELANRSPRDASALAAEIAAQNAAHGKPLTRDQTRNLVTRRRQQTGEAPDPRHLFDASAHIAGAPDDLWCNDLSRRTLPVATSMAIHDLTALVQSHVQNERSLDRKPDPAVTALLKALTHPTITGFVESLGGLHE